MTAESGWPDLIGQPIETVEVTWEHRAALCSRSWVLRFAGDREVVITLGDRDTEGRFVPFSPSNLAVFFSRETARRHGASVPGG